MQRAFLCEFMVAALTNLHGEIPRMSDLIERRNFLGLAIGGVTGARMRAATENFWTPAIPESAVPHLRVVRASASFPKQDPAMVQEFVGAAHSNLPRVKELLEAHPALARATLDWGFGDWEDALGGASHTGRAEIAELLIARGARPTIFSAAMLGQLDTVKAFITAMPGCQRILGPHSITLLSHAKAGGERAKTTLAYLEQLGDADTSPTPVPLDAAKRSTYVGTYAYGAADDEKVEVAATGAGGLSIARPGLSSARNLKHLGNHEFFPAGAEFVRIRFNVVGDSATKVEVFDPDQVITGVRQG